VWVSEAMASLEGERNLQIYNNGELSTVLIGKILQAIAEYP
jgi:hypothetical protein